MTLDDFIRTIDQAFDDILLDPWGVQSALHRQAPVVTETSDAYQVLIQTGPVDPELLEIEVSPRHLRVYLRQGGPRAFDKSFLFAEPVNDALVTARFFNNKLVIALPKQRARRIPVKVES